MFVTYNWAIANTGSVVPLGAFYIDIQQINKFAVVMKSKSDIRGEDADADAGAGARVGGRRSYFVWFAWIIPPSLLWHL